MDIFAPDVGFSADKPYINGTPAIANVPSTTLGATGNYVFDPNGVARNPQFQSLATSLGAGAVSPYEGAVSLGAYAAALANACTAVGFHARANVYSAVAVGDQASALAHRTIAIGRAASATGINSIAIGAQAQAAGLRGVAVGGGARAGGINTTSLGYLSGSLGESSITLGSISYSTGTGGITIGTGIQNIHHQSVIIGVNARSVMDNAFAAGSDVSPYRDVWFGKGNVVDPALGPIGAWTLHGEESFGFANQPGGNLNLAGGRSTGTGVGGTVNIQTCNPGVAGSALNPLVTRMSVTPTGVTIAAGIPFSGEQIILTTANPALTPLVINKPSTIGTNPTIRIKGHSVSYELMNSNFTANWYFGLDEAGGNSCVIGTGYGTGQGIPPAMRISQNNDVKFIGNVGIHRTGAVQAIFTLNGAPGNYRFIEGATNGSRRWLLSPGNSSEETGSNAGSDFSLIAYDDGGNGIDTPIAVVRAPGQPIYLSRRVIITGQLDVSGPIVAGSISYTDLAVSGKLISTTPQQVLAASIGGDMVVTQFFMGPSYKAIIVQFRNHLGVSGFTFALPFAAVPMKFEQPTIVNITSLTNAQITFNTGTTLNGWLKLEGF